MILLISEIVRTVLIMSISGSIIALLLFALKPLARNRLPKSAQYYLWLVVIAALLVPFSNIITIRTDVTMPLPVAPIQSALERVPLTSTDEIGLWQSDPNRPQTQEEVQRFKASQNQFLKLPYLYPFVAAAVFLYHIIAYAIFTRKIRRNNKKADVACAIPVCLNAKANTPMLIGLFRPVIVLPDCEYSDGQLRAVLLHEMTHLRRKDILVKWLSVIACSVHWFNPVVWLARREIDRVCELACDETVIRNLDADGIRNYGDTLIYVAADSKTPHAVLSTTMCEEKKALKERLGAIMNSRKHTRPAAAVSAVLVLAAILTACTLGAGQSAPNGSVEMQTPETVPAGQPTPNNSAGIQTPEITPVSQYQTEADFLNSVDGVAFQSVAYQAAKALLRADADALSVYMADPAEAVNATNYMTDIFDDLDYMFLIWSLDSIKSEHEINASYRYLVTGEDSVSYVTMELVKTDDVWKVQQLWIEK